MPKNIFITFGGPSANYHNAVDRICREAHNFEFFDEILGFTEKDLMSDESYWKKQGAFLEQNKRGYGFWSWKPHIIKRVMDALEEGDFLFYCDSGCKLNKRGLPRLYEYMDLLSNNKDGYGILSFQLNHPEIWFTKRRTLEYFQVSEQEANDPQCMATVVIIRKNQHSVRIINEWSIICINERWLIDDELSNQEYPAFREHRHDQSVFSLLVKKYGSVKIADETYFAPDWNANGANYPIWAMRHRF